MIYMTIEVFYSMRLASATMSNAVATCNTLPWGWITLMELCVVYAFNAVAVIKFMFASIYRFCFYFIFVVVVLFSHIIAMCLLCMFWYFIAFSFGKSKRWLYLLPLNDKYYRWTGTCVYFITMIIIELC